MPTFYMSKALCTTEWHLGNDKEYISSGHRSTVSANQGIRCMIIKTQSLSSDDGKYLITLILSDFQMGEEGHGCLLWYLAVSGEHIQPELTNNNNNNSSFVIRPSPLEIG